MNDRKNFQNYTFTLSHSGSQGLLLTRVALPLLQHTLAGDVSTKCWGQRDGPATKAIATMATILI